MSRNRRIGSSSLPHDCFGWARWASTWQAFRWKVNSRTRCRHCAATAHCRAWSMTGGAPTRRRALPPATRRAPSRRAVRRPPPPYPLDSISTRARNARGISRITTAERTGAESDRQPSLAPDEIAGLRVALTDGAPRKAMKQAGAAWNPDRTVWPLRYDRVIGRRRRPRIGPRRHPVLDAPASSEKHPAADAAPHPPGDAGIQLWTPGINS